MARWSDWWVDKISICLDLKKIKFITNFTSLWRQCDGTRTYWNRWDTIYEKELDEQCVLMAKHPFSRRFGYMYLVFLRERILEPESERQCRNFNSDSSCGFKFNKNMRDVGCYNLSTRLSKISRLCFRYFIMKCCANPCIFSQLHDQIPNLPRHHDPNRWIIINFPCRPYIEFMLDP